MVLWKKNVEKEEFDVEHILATRINNDGEVSKTRDTDTR